MDALATPTVLPGEERIARGEVWSVYLTVFA